MKIKFKNDTDRRNFILMLMVEDVRIEINGSPAWFTKSVKNEGTEVVVEFTAPTKDRK